MALFFPKRRVSDAENKLRLLLCLRALGMASSEQLWPFVAQLELMEYLPYCLLLDELKKAGVVALGRYALEGMLYLTPEGEKTLALLGDKLIPTDCERIRQAAPGAFHAVGTVREGDVPTLVLDVRTVDEALARAAVGGFRACAPRLLTLLYTLPFEEKGPDLPRRRGQEEALEEALAGHPGLLAYGGPERAAAVALREGGNAYGVLLLLPDRGAAQGWAAAAEADGEALARRVTELIREEAGGREP